MLVYSCIFHVKFEFTKGNFSNKSDQTKFITIHDFKTNDEIRLMNFAR